MTTYPIRGVDRHPSHVRLPTPKSTRNVLRSRRTSGSKPRRPGYANTTHHVTTCKFQQKHQIHRTLAPCRLHEPHIATSTTAPILPSTTTGKMTRIHSEHWTNYGSGRLFSTKLSSVISMAFVLMHWVNESTRGPTVHRYTPRNNGVDSASKSEQSFWNNGKRC